MDAKRPFLKDPSTFPQMKADTNVNCGSFSQGQFKIHASHRNNWALSQNYETITLMLEYVIFSGQLSMQIEVNTGDGQLWRG